MKRDSLINLKHLFILCFMLLCFCANAKKVEIGTATSVANFFVSQTFDHDLSKNTNLNLVYTAVNAAHPEKPIYYVFNVGNNDGFIIVAGDDMALPILGYSTHGAYQPDNIPSNFEAWMNSVATAIEQGVQKGETADDEVSMEWDALLSQDVHYFLQRDGAKAVSPLVATKWDQSNPYYLLCPTYSGYRCLTGCVATAMAQLMKYHQYPASATGTTPAYTTSTHGISVPAVTLGASYDWASMLNTYSSSATQTQKDAVALLMYHAGVSVKMDYGPSASGAMKQDAGKALTSYFKYDKAMLLHFRSYYSDADWMSLIKTELDANRPVYYSGSGYEGGHAFICDGYDNNNKFHFNWGWSGSNDGYFTINPMPSSLFPENNRIFTGLKPDAGGTAACQIDLYEDTNLTASTTTVQIMEDFTVSGQLYNTGYTDGVNFQIAVGLYQGNTLINTLSARTMSLQAGYYTSSPNHFTCQIPATIPTGDYTVRIITKAAGTDTWVPAKATNGYTGELALKVTPKAFIITAMAEENGTITPQGEVSVEEGKDQTFTFKADAGYKLSKVLVDGINNPTAVTEESYTFTNVTTTHFITARFERMTHIITAWSNENGSISPTGRIPVNEGDDKTFTIVADDGYEIADILVDEKSVDVQESYTFSNVTQEHTIEVIFRPKTAIGEVETAKLQVYPNPTSGTLKIKNETLKIKNITVFDITGRLVFEVNGMNDREIKVDLSDLVDGVYFLKTGNSVIKVVKH